MSEAIVHPNVRWLGDYELGDFVIVGLVPEGLSADEATTVIGAGAFIRSHSVLYAGSVIGKRFRTGHGALVREGCRIGDDVSVGTGSGVGHHVSIGHGVRIHSRTSVAEFTVLEDECWLGPNVVLANARYPRSPGVKDRLESPIVERGARLGASVTVLPGVRIGAGSLVGAGSVVTRDVPPGVVVAGNPARFLKPVEGAVYRDEEP
ncbi:MAG TPA: acyltransferase [Thermoanaerobaculia bacterium]|nr:acyltransferase [Thermoanaerobaculia bacterium]